MDFAPARLDFGASMNLRAMIYFMETEIKKSADRAKLTRQEFFRATLRAIERVKTRILVHFEGFRAASNRTQKTLQPFELQGFKSGTPGGTRTPNLLIRSQTIYPIDLRVPCGAARGGKKPNFPLAVKNFGREFHKISGFP